MPHKSAQKSYPAAPGHPGKALKPMPVKPPRLPKPMARPQKKV